LRNQAHQNKQLQHPAIRRSPARGEITCGSLLLERLLGGNGKPSGFPMLPFSHRFSHEHHSLYARGTNQRRGLRPPISLWAKEIQSFFAATNARPLQQLGPPGPKPRVLARPGGAGAPSRAVQGRAGAARGRGILDYRRGGGRSSCRRGWGGSYGGE
jgi:hypothetical protein